MDPADPKPKRRPRVSLLSLFLLTALVATSITTVMLWREVGPLRSEVSRLRVETGQLTVTDPKRIYAVAIDTMEPDSWKWRVYWPPGHDFRIATTLRQIAGRTPGKTKAEWFAACGSNCAISVESGEFTLALKLEPEPSHPNGQGHWNVRIRTQQKIGKDLTTIGSGVCGTVIEWLEDYRSRDTTSDVRPGGPQVELDAREGLELLTLRRSKIVEVANGWSSTPADSTKESEGIGVRIVAR